jgi:tRNA nucleotidyltransferase (CCA-adding enzyme)
MEIYQVGGSVRDELLGEPVADRDFLVVGSSPEQMIAQGFLPVGKDFPVFLHPHSHEEYALARTERKTAPGYQGFVFHTSPEVTLEQDLIRRDLTINAIARHADGSLIDPFGGQQDLAQGILRHVSLAFTEDPVRILRLARFAARFTRFVVAPETMQLMQNMVAHGEVDALVAERVWQELARGLQEAEPMRMFQILHECGALARLMPELSELGFATALGRAAQAGLGLAQRFACVGQSVADGKRLQALCQRLRVPHECSELGQMLQRELPSLRQPGDASAMVALMQRCDAWRKPERFLLLLQTLPCFAVSKIDITLWQRSMQAARLVASGEIAKNYQNQPDKIAAAILAARILAVDQSIRAES